ncbi:LAFE_0B00760g1_1 [Lachancea fermentati]|uniref:Regulator of free ubiquitin chains 1 n=1 Tax=Lachancea fermentati TaxID=4955 RepID=A0A1G4M7F4_LACFM|nr:LAFE_0B00760g1_1 [Lachancea fermentati]
MKSSLQLSKEALEYTFNPKIPLKLYLKTCISLVEEAQTSFQDGRLERSYLMYLRYLDLCMNKLPNHPEVTESSTNSECSLFRKEYQQLLKLEVPAILRISEDLKAQIDISYQKNTLSLATNVPKRVVKERANTEAIELPSSFSDAKLRQSIHAFHNDNISMGNLVSSSTAPLIYPDLPKLSNSTYASI